MSKAVHLNILETFRFHYEDEIFKVFFAYSQKYTPRTKQTKLCFFHQKDQKVIFH